MDLLQKIRKLPEPVQDYLYSESLLHGNGQVIERNALDFEGQKTFLRLLQRVFAREVPMSDLEKEASALVGGDEGKSKALARDIAGYCLLPLDRWLGDVSGYVRRLGGDVSSYPAERIQMVERTRDEAASEVVSSSDGAAEATARARERMRDVVTSFLAGIRTEEQALEVLTRSDKIGGVGLDPSAARSVIDHAKEEQRTVVIKEAPAVGAPPAAAPQAPSAPAPKPKEDFVMIAPEDEEEIALLKEKASSAKGTQQADETARRIQASIDRIYLDSGLATDDEDFSKRVKTVIGNRLRDVRDQMETLETMVQPKELGGLGLGQESARRLLGIIQGSLQEVHEAHAERIEGEKAAWVEKERRKAAEAPAQEAAAQESDLERLYRSIVAKSKKATKMAAVAAPVAAPTPAMAAAPASKFPSPPSNLPVSDVHIIPPHLRAPVTIPLPEVEIAPVRTFMPQPPLTLVKPVPGAPAPMPAFSVVPGQPNRPRMEDVKAAPKLTGPVEELRAITVVDFRRLSKDPKEACMKVKDKIDLLAEQSYTRRTEGLKAWSASEVVRTYLELMREGLNGMPFKEAVAAREAAKRPFLTAEEFQAIGELSRQLRY
mgnify:CR=1 FL=1